MTTHRISPAAGGFQTTDVGPGLAYRPGAAPRGTLRPPADVFAADGFRGLRHHPHAHSHHGGPHGAGRPESSSGATEPGALQAKLQQLVADLEALLAQFGAGGSEAVPASPEPAPATDGSTGASA